MGLMFSVMGMFDLYDASLQSLTQAVMGSSSAGGVVGQVLNDAFIVKILRSAWRFHHLRHCLPGESGGRHQHGHWCFSDGALGAPQRSP